MKAPIKDTSSQAPMEKAADKSMYFVKLANTYRIARLFLCGLLAFFLVLTLLFGSASIQGVHFRYLTKYIFIDPLAPVDELGISYAAGSDALFALYNDDLAVLSEGKMALYSPSGDLRFRADTEAGAPALHSSGMYLASYVPGKTKLSFFHSFGKAYETVFSSPISKAVVSDSGVTAVCLRKESTDTILILNRKFEEETEITPSSGIVMDLALSKNGEKLAVLSLLGASGAYYTRLELFKASSGELIHTQLFSGEKPLSVGFFNDGRFYVSLERTLHFHASDGDKKGSYSIPASSKLHTDGERILLLTPSGELSLYESTGKCLFSEAVPAGALSIKVKNDRIYLLLGGKLFVYDQKGSPVSEISVPSGALDFFSLRDGSILLCFPSEAKPIS